MKTLLFSCCTVYWIVEAQHKIEQWVLGFMV